MVRVTTTVWYHGRGRDGASEPIITIDNKAFVLIIEGIIWPNVRGTCPHFSLNSPCSRNSWWGHSKGIRKPQHFTRFSAKVPFHKILSGNNLYHCSFNAMETSTLELQKRLTIFQSSVIAIIWLFWEYPNKIKSFADIHCNIHGMETFRVQWLLVDTFWWILVVTLVHEKSPFWVNFRGHLWVNFSVHFLMVISNSANTGGAGAKGTLFG